MTPFGAQFFVPHNLPALRQRQLPEPVWPWTDGTEMACSVFDVLRHRGRVDQYELARSFVGRHDFDRGYGPGNEPPAAPDPGGRAVVGVGGWAVRRAGLVG